MQIINVNKKRDNGQQSELTYREILVISRSKRFPMIRQEEGFSILQLVPRRLRPAAGKGVLCIRIGLDGIGRGLDWEAGENHS
jgi:hypothetical protein